MNQIINIISVSILISVAILNSICYSQMEIVINGNVVIEQINNNENAVELATPSPIVSTQATDITTRTTTPSTTTTTTTTTTITTTTTTTTTATTINKFLKFMMLVFFYKNKNIDKSVYNDFIFNIC